MLPNLRAADSWSFKVGDPLGTGGQWALPWGFETNAIAYQDVFQQARAEAGGDPRRVGGVSRGPQREG